MSYLSTQKTTEFTEKLVQRVQEPGFSDRQAEYERAIAESNASLTALLASCREKGDPATEEELRAFPSPGESPLEVLSREIYEEMAT